MINSTMWDTQTTGSLGAAQTMTFREVRCQIIPHGPSAGRTQVTDSGGRLIKAAEMVNVPEFQQYILDLIRR
jgi:inosine-uridine nucleoside N-ribohydrolase